MQLFPVFLHLVGRACLVVGGGRVGFAKAERLASAGADVLVIEPSPSQTLLELAASSPQVRVEHRVFCAADCQGRVLVFACTADALVNADVTAAAAEHGGLCCRTDDGAAGDFSLGATLERGDLRISISTGGASPALAKAARDRIAEVIGAQYGEAAAMMADLRARLRSGDGDRSAQGRDRDFLAQLVPEVLGLLQSGRRSEAESRMEAALHALTEQGFQEERAEGCAGDSACTR